MVVAKALLPAEFLSKVLVSAEYEDLNGGCPTPANSSVRPAYIYPVDNTISDPWAYFKRTLTFQVHMPHQLWALHVALTIWQRLLQLAVCTALCSGAACCSNFYGSMTKWHRTKHKESRAENKSCCV